MLRNFNVKSFFFLLDFMQCFSFGALLQYVDQYVQPSQLHALCGGSVGLPVTVII